MPIEGVLRRGSRRACQTRLVVSMLLMSEEARSERPQLVAMGWPCMNSSTAWQACWPASTILTRAFQQRYPLVQMEEDRIFVMDGQVWTSAGMSAGLDLALAVIEKDLGREVALMIARKLVIYQRRGGGQSQFSALLELDAKSDRVQTALT